MSNSRNKDKNRKGNERNGNANCSNESQAFNVRAQESPITTAKYYGSSRDNDLSWHAKDTRWLESAANVGYGLPIGARQYWGEAGGGLANNTAIPGIMTFIFTPTYGAVNNENAELNRAMVNMFTKVRSKISGKREYERTDLMKYLIAIDSIYMFYAFCLRAYRCLNITSHTNYYIQKALVEAMGLNFEDLMRRSTQFYDLLREIRLSAAQFCIPKAMDIYQRHSWMLSHIWKDDDSDSAQLYMFLPRTFYYWRDVYDDATRPGIAPTGIQWIDNVSPLGTLDNLWDLFHSIYDPIQRNGDVAQMSADIASVYGSEIWVPDDVMIGEAYKPEYNAEALMQIHNLTMVGDFELNKTRNVIFEPLDIPAKHGYLASDFRFVHPYRKLRDDDGNIPGSAGFMVRHNINFTDAVTTPAGTMIATRLTNIPDSVNSEGYWEWSSYTTEVVNYARIHYFSIMNYADSQKTLPGNYNVYDLQHYETERIFSSMMLTDALFTDVEPENIDSSTAWTPQMVVRPWDLPTHCYNFAYGSVTVDWNTNELFNQTTNQRNLRPWNAIRTMMSVFNWHPAVAYVSTTVCRAGSGHTKFKTTAFMGFDQDLDVCGIIDKEALREMNKLDVASEFDALR